MIKKNVLFTEPLKIVLIICIAHSKRFVLLKMPAKLD